MYPGVPSASRSPATATSRVIGYRSVDRMAAALRGLEGPTWLTIHEESEADRRVAARAGFRKVGVKFSSLGDVYGIYPAGDPERRHPAVDPAEIPALRRVTHGPVAAAAKALASAVARRLAGDVGEELRFANHYSNYNKRRSWSALALRGFGAEPSMIEKPPR